MYGTHRRTFPSHVNGTAEARPHRSLAPESVGFELLDAIDLRVRMVLTRASLACLTADYYDHLRSPSFSTLNPLVRLTYQTKATTRQGIPPTKRSIEPDPIPKKKSYSSHISPSPMPLFLNPAKAKRRGNVQK